MKPSITAAALAAVLAFAATPAIALPPQASDKAKEESAQGQANKPAAAPGPKASAESKRKAYGKYCQDQSKKHVKGEKGTPFSQCVTAMAKAAKNERTSAREACKGMSKKHVKGSKGTPFSRCVVAAAQLKKDQEEEQAS